MATHVHKAFTSTVFEYCCCLYSDAMRLQSIAGVIVRGLDGWLADVSATIDRIEADSASWATYLTSKLWGSKKVADEGVDAAPRASVLHASVDTWSGFLSGLSAGTRDTCSRKWLDMFCGLLLLYEMLFRNSNFARALYECDRAAAR